MAKVKGLEYGDGKGSDGRRSHGGYGNLDLRWYGWIRFEARLKKVSWPKNLDLGWFRRGLA